MHLMDATSLILVVLAILIVGMVWGIRDAIETSIEYQEEILAELVYAKFRSGNRAKPGQESAKHQEAGGLQSEEFEVLA
jgi:hypothetical protein